MKNNELVKSILSMVSNLFQTARRRSALEVKPMQPMKGKNIKGIIEEVTIL